MTKLMSVIVGLSFLLSSCATNNNGEDSTLRAIAVPVIQIAAIELYRKEGKDVERAINLVRSVLSESQDIDLTLIQDVRLRLLADSLLKNYIAQADASELRPVWIRDLKTALDDVLPLLGGTK